MAGVADNETGAVTVGAGTVHVDVAAAIGNVTLSVASETVQKDVAGVAWRI